MPKSEMSIWQHLYAFGGWRTASLLLVVLMSMRGMELNHMVATIPADMFVEVMIVLAIVTIVTGLIVMVVRWDMHLAAEDKARGPISWKHVAAGVLGMILAVGLSLVLVPIVVTKIVEAPAALDYQVYGGILAFVIAILLVALTQFGFSKVKDFIERAGTGICDLILTGKATAEQIAAAIAEATPKEKKKIAAAITEKQEMDKQAAILAAAAKVEPVIENPPKEE